jgi:hypothetical protein
MTLPFRPPVLAYVLWRSDSLADSALGPVFALRLHADGSTSILARRPDLALDELKFDWGSDTPALSTTHLAAALLADAIGDAVAEQLDVAFADYLAGGDDDAMLLTREEIREWHRELSADEPAIEPPDDPDEDDPDEDDSLASQPFGACCLCQRSGPTVRNFVTLPERAPVPGTGWGCVECGLPADGAMAIVCDPCADRLQEELNSDSIREVIYGLPARGGRCPRAADPEAFVHDRSRHVELQGGGDAWVI